MYEAGETIGGKYRIEERLAKGGMGVVVAATHIKLGIKVALKFLRDDYVKEQRIVDRFVKEAQAAAQIVNEHVCRVSDVEVTDTGVPYIVMELLRGRDLQTVLRTAPLDVPTATSYVLQARIGIAEAHAIRIVHRDLKPANLFLTYRSDGRPLIKVLDFGVAKAPPRSEDHGMTDTQTVMGSPGYMSPEQLRSSRTVDMRTDIWSLGVVLYELVLGKRPWVAESTTELTLKIANDPLPDMPASLPAGFTATIARCLNKTPERRFRSVAELAAALAPFAPDGPELASSTKRVIANASGVFEAAAAESAAPPTEVVEGGAMPTTLRTASGVGAGAKDVRSRFPAKLVLGGAGVLGAAILAFAVYGRGDGPDTPRPSTTPPPPPPATATPTDVPAPPATPTP